MYLPLPLLLSRSSTLRVTLAFLLPYGRTSLGVRPSSRASCSTSFGSWLRAISISLQHIMIHKLSRLNINKWNFCKKGFYRKRFSLKKPFFTFKPILLVRPLFPVVTQNFATAHICSRMHSPDRSNGHQKWFASWPQFVLPAATTSELYFTSIVFLYISYFNWDKIYLLNWTQQIKK